MGAEVVMVDGNVENLVKGTGIVLVGPIIFKDDENASNAKKRNQVSVHLKTNFITGN